MVRFGKLLRLQYGGGQLRGAVIDTFLLEKTRVTHQPYGERNFHVLHQVAHVLHQITPMLEQATRFLHGIKRGAHTRVLRVLQ